MAVSRPLKLLLSSEQLDALRAIKVRTGVPLNEQVRRLVIDWIALHGEAEAVSVGPVTPGSGEAPFGRT